MKRALLNIRHEMVFYLAKQSLFLALPLML